MADEIQEKEVEDMMNYLFEVIEDYCKTNDLDTNVVLSSLVNVIARVLICTLKDIVDIRDIADSIKSAIINAGVAYEISQEDKEKS